jgi:hypothetical protein
VTKENLSRKLLELSASPIAAVRAVQGDRDVCSIASSQEAQPSSRVDPRERGGTSSGATSTVDRPMSGRQAAAGTGLPLGACVRQNPPAPDHNARGRREVKQYGTQELGGAGEESLVGAGH